LKLYALGVVWDCECIESLLVRFFVSVPFALDGVGEVGAGGAGFESSSPSIGAACDVGVGVVGVVVGDDGGGFGAAAAGFESSVPCGTDVLVVLDGTWIRL